MWYTLDTDVTARGRIAQLGERFPYKEEVTGSSPVSPIAQRPRQVAEAFVDVYALCSFLPGRNVWLVCASCRL